MRIMLRHGNARIPIVYYALTATTFKPQPLVTLRPAGLRLMQSHVGLGSVSAHSLFAFLALSASFAVSLHFQNPSNRKRTHLPQSLFLVDFRYRSANKFCRLVHVLNCKRYSLSYQGFNFGVSVVPGIFYVNMPD